METNCDGVREHLESCEECRLHVVVEARLRTQPVLEPPPDLLNRVMKALPRKVPVGREFVRLAAAAALLVGLLAGLVSLGLDRHEAVLQVREEAQVLIEMTANLNPLR